MATVDLRRPKYSPSENPFINGNEIKTKSALVRTKSAAKDLVDPDTGEIAGASVIHQIVEKDPEHFVKVFAEGVAKAFELKRGSFRVFQAILKEYQKAKMSGGYVDQIHLAWFDDGLNGEKIGMSDRTFHRGLKELIEKEFLYPKMPNVYWVNPSLFFRGDRVAFVREYRIKKTQETLGRFTDG